MERDACLIFYKITKIVRALGLAERSVCMRVCKHGCGVKLFCFSRATPLVFISGYANTENVFYCVNNPGDGCLFEEGRLLERGHFFEEIPYLTK